jgi:glycosyltransferase involved in cell wall biosynthesis
VRVLICAPWFRTLARIHARALVAAGHQVLIVTTVAQGDRSGTQEVEELTVGPELKSVSAVMGTLSTRRKIAMWNPDISMVDDTWDPRFHFFANVAPRRILAVHDPEPHDADHTRRGWKGLVQGRARHQASNVATFSRFASESLKSESRVYVLPLSSEVDDSARVATRSEQQGFCFVGRVSQYKGLDFLLEAWPIFQACHPQERLTILGSGINDLELPEGVIWLNHKYSDSEAAGLISGCRAVVLPYREASQSGVQVLSLQLATPTIVTRVGALPEFQPPGFPIVEFGDVESLVASLSLMAIDDPKRAPEARNHYESTFGTQILTEALDRMIGSVCQERS